MATGVSHGAYHAHASGLHNTQGKSSKESDVLVKLYCTPAPSKGDLSTLGETHTVTVESSDTRIKALLVETLKVFSGETSQKEDIVEENPREILKRIHSKIHGNSDPIQRVVKLLELREEYLSLEDLMEEDEQYAHSILGETLSILSTSNTKKSTQTSLEKKIPDPSARARVWLAIMEKCRQAEVFLFTDWAERNLNRDLDILIEILPYIKDYNLYCEIQFEVIRIYEEKEEFNNVQFFLKEVCEVLELISNDNKKMKILMQASSIYGSCGYNKSALNILERALHLANTWKDTPKKLKILIKMLIECEVYNSSEGSNLLQRMQSTFFITKRNCFIAALELLKQQFSVAKEEKEDSKKLETLGKIEKECEKYNELEEGLRLLKEVKDAISQIEAPFLVQA